MIICFDIQRDTKSQMDEMVQDGDYRDYSELLAVAVANQHLLHVSRRVNGLPTVTPALQPLSTPEEPRFGGKLPAKEVNAAYRPGGQEESIPAIFLKPNGQPQLSLAPLPNDAFARGMTVTADRWIFGQHNKLLPAKANVRALVNLLGCETKPVGVDLDDASREIATSASELGNYLRSLDLHSERSRDDSLALAFPSSEASNSDKSRLRYANQFVGSLSREGRMTGLLVDFKFVNVDRHKPPRIRLTEAGLRFAQLVNPILDGSMGEALEKFSSEEVEFIIAHIKENIPVEDFAYDVTLGAIRAGNDTPESLDRALKQYLPDRKERPFTDAFLTTQRAGVISRMADIGLVARTRSGSNVTYVLTEQGMQFIQKGQAK
jgi:hypothetical protein